MERVIFSGMLVLACCLFVGIGTVNGGTVDISGQCVDMVIPSPGGTATANDVCQAAGYISCHDVNGGNVDLFNIIGCGGAPFNLGMLANCNDVFTNTTAIFSQSLTIDYLICDDGGMRTWGMIPQPDNVPGDFNQSIKSATDWILGFVAMIAVLMLIWGGVNYLTSAGDEDKTRTGKRTIQYALVGLVVAGIAYALVNVIITVIL